MSSLNQCQFIGNLGRDPEIRRLNNGDPVASISIACTEKWRDRGSGERKERTEWVRCVVYGKLAEVFEKYVQKGSKVYVSGRMQTRKYNDQAGVEKYATEIVVSELIMLDGKRQDDGRRDDHDEYGQAHDPGQRSSGQRNGGLGEPYRGKTEDRGFGGGRGGHYDDDEIPF